MQLFTLFRTVLFVILNRNISRFEEKHEELQVVETIKVLGNQGNTQEDNPFAIEGDLQEDLPEVIVHSLNKLENILMERGFCQEISNQNSTLEEEDVDFDPNYVVTKCMHRNQIDPRCNKIQDLLTCIQNELKAIPIAGKNMPRRAHLAGHQDRLKRGRGSALQKAILEFQQCRCRNEQPNGKDEKPIGPNEPKEIGVLKDVTMENQESEQDEVRKDDQPEEEYPEGVCPEKDPRSKEVEKSKLEMALKNVADKLETEWNNKAKQQEERFLDMLDTKLDLMGHRTNFNKGNEVPPATQGQEKLRSVVQNLQTDINRCREDFQRWRMQQECKGDLGSELNELKKEKENYLEEKKKIKMELEEERKRGEDKDSEIHQLKEQLHLYSRAEMNHWMRDTLEKTEERREKEEIISDTNKRVNESEEIVENDGRNNEFALENFENKSQVNDLKTKIEKQEEDAVSPRISNLISHLVNSDKEMDPSYHTLGSLLLKETQELQESTDLNSEDKFERKSVVCVPEETEEERNNSTLYQTPWLRYLAAVKQTHLEPKSKTIQDLLTCIRNDLRTIPIDRKNMPRRAHLAGHLDRLKRGRGSALQKAILEFQQCRCQNERPNGKQEKPIGPNEPKEIGVLKDVTIQKQEPVKEEERKDFLEDKREEESISKERKDFLEDKGEEESISNKEQVKLQGIMESFYNDMQTRINNSMIKMEERMQDRLDEKLEKFRLQTQNSNNFSNEIPADNQEQEDLQSMIQNIQKDFTHYQEDIQGWQRQQRGIGDLGSEKENNRLKRENEILVEENRKILQELEEERESRKEMENDKNLPIDINELYKTHELQDAVIAKNENDIKQMKAVIEELRIDNIRKADRIETLENLLDIYKVVLQEHQKSTVLNSEDKFERKSVVCVPQETEEEPNNSTLDQTPWLRYLSAVKQTHLEPKSNTIQDLLTCIRNELKAIPIDRKNMPRRAHLAGHQDRLKRGRGSALQKAILEFQQCRCRNEQPNGKDEKPIGPNEPKEIGVLKDVTMENQESEQDEVRKDDQPEEECPEGVCPEKDPRSKEVEKSKLEMALKNVADKLETEWNNKAKQQEERFLDMLDTKLDLMGHRTNFNKGNEVPPATQGHEKLQSVVQNLQTDINRCREDFQRWRMQQECKGDLGSELNELKEEKENYLEEKKKIQAELEEERERNKALKALRSQDIIEIKRLKKEKENYLEEKKKIQAELEEERKRGEDKDSEIHQLKEQLHLYSRAEMNHWMRDTLEKTEERREKEEIISDTNKRVNESEEIVENDGRNNEFALENFENKSQVNDLKTKIEKQEEDAVSPRISNLISHLVNSDKEMDPSYHTLGSLLLKETQELQESTDLNSEDKFERKSVVCVPEETEEERNNSTLYQTPWLRYLSAVKQTHLEPKSKTIQDLLTCIRNDLRTIPIDGKNMPRRAHLEGHQDRLKRARGSALQKVILEFQQCRCRNERPNGKQEKPIGPNEPKEIGVLKDVTIQKQEPEKEEERKDFLEDKGEESISNKEQVKLQGIMESFYNDMQTRINNSMIKMEERMQDRLDEKLEKFRLQTQNSNNFSNEIPADNQEQEDLQSMVQNIQKDFTHYQEDIQGWQRQQRGIGDLGSEKENNRLKRENEILVEENRKILQELEEERESRKEMENDKNLPIDINELYKIQELQDAVIAKNENDIKQMKAVIEELRIDIIRKADRIETLENLLDIYKKVLQEHQKSTVLNSEDKFERKSVVCVPQETEEEPNNATLDQTLAGMPHSSETQSFAPR
ncbi:trichohyalin-like [Palaemon carinicauda]|uniref:trichohyalin-like n=1 Tax=Palaemon carinicauda TaxID=392227 RepID=UPI0035B67C59